MLAGHQIKNHLQRTGGTMLGDLDMVAQKIKFSNGDVSISVTPASSYLKILDLAGAVNKHLWADTLNIQGNVLMAAGKTVDGRDISELVRARCKAGIYSGNGVDDRQIDIGVDLTAKTNVKVFVQATTRGWEPILRIETAQGDLSKRTTAAAEQANEIQALTATGFELGSGNYSNENTYGYRYYVTWEEP